MKSNKTKLRKKGVAVRSSAGLADLSEQKVAALSIWLKGEGDLKRVRQRQRGLWQRYMNITKKIQRLQWSKVG